VKVLPCDTCGDAAQLPSGQPYVIGRTPDGIERHPFSIKCSKCKRTMTFTAAAFNRLPDIGLAEMRALGLENLAMKDLLGAGLTLEQVEQAEAAGMTLEEMHPSLEARNG
jgi:hypothetical protein